VRNRRLGAYFFGCVLLWLGAFGILRSLKNLLRVHLRGVSFRMMLGRGGAMSHESFLCVSFYILADVVRSMFAEAMYSEQKARRPHYAGRPAHRNHQAPRNFCHCPVHDAKLWAARLAALRSTRRALLLQQLLVLLGPRGRFCRGVVPAYARASTAHSYSASFLGKKSTVAEGVDIARLCFHRGFACSAERGPHLHKHAGHP
jgi:hypothetical protein